MGDARFYVSTQCGQVLVAASPDESQNLSSNVWARRSLCRVVFLSVATCAIATTCWASWSVGAFIAGHQSDESGFAAHPRRLAKKMCTQNSRWKNLAYVQLTYVERLLWQDFGWSEPTWDRAWGANSNVSRSATGRCFGDKYIIGESGEDACLNGELVLTEEECKTASAEYNKSFGVDIQPLGSAITEPNSMPGCRIQDRVGFQFNTVQHPARTVGHSLVCKIDTGCPSTTTPAPVPLMPGELPEAVQHCYQNLTRGQQDAVRLLGYSIDSWHKCMREDWEPAPPTCQWPPSVPEENAPCLERLDWIHGEYNVSKPWKDLSPRVKQSLMDLGWDQPGNLWKIQDYPDSYFKTFSDPPPAGLTDVQKKAAEFLRYTKDTWGGCENTSKCLVRLGRLENTFASWGTFQEMPEGSRNFLKALGWTEKLWIDGQPPALYASKWENLRFPEKIAATKLGYHKDTWENCEASSCLDRFEYVALKYKTVKWSQMKLAKKNAWTMLEHNEELWNQGGMKQTRMFAMRWAELAPSQQRQATFLGHNMGTWQGCNYDWGTTDEVAQTPKDVGGPFRTVRVRMVIEAPFSSISGNIYGRQVASMPASFIEVFERSIARALFCGNPEFKEYVNGAKGPDGLALCFLPEDFEQQRRRIRVITVLEGSIVVDFIIVKNQTLHELPSFALYDKLRIQLESTATPICQDIEFGRYAQVATVQETDLSNLDQEGREHAIMFEKLRGSYNDQNACNLHVDARDPNGCTHKSLSSRSLNSLLGAFLSFLLPALLVFYS